jgi:hypothetical protein
LENCHFRSCNFCCTPIFMAVAADHATEKSNTEPITRRTETKLCYVGSYQQDSMQTQQLSGVT